MSSKLIVFDTTLRDGEQAPGFSMRVDEKVRMARAARGPGRRHHGGRVPHSVGSRRRGGAARRPRAGAAGRGSAGAMRAGGHRPRSVGDRARSPGAHPHVHRDVRPAPRAQASDDARGLSRRGGAGRDARPDLHRRRGVFSRGRDAKRLRLPLPRHRGRRRRGRDDDQSAGHGRVFDAGRDRGVLPRRDRARAERRSRGVQRALS